MWIGGGKALHFPTIWSSMGGQLYRLPKSPSNTPALRTFQANRLADLHVLDIYVFGRGIALK